MWHVGTWLTDLDAKILTFFEEHRMAFQAVGVWYNGDFDCIQRSINRRFYILEDAGLLTPIKHRGYYEITERGIALVNGELTKEEIEAIEPEDKY